MSTLLGANRISIGFAADPLFCDLTLQISSASRLGIIGPNGAGKSTLLKILSGDLEPDSGTISQKKDLRVSFVAQSREFGGEATVLETVVAEAGMLAEDERDWKCAVALSAVGFADHGLMIETLSGGWRKRLSLACGIVAEPDILLLDEPTNHLDMAGILWLEQYLRESSFAWIAISHDRLFLERTATDVLEINSVYPEGSLEVKGNYSSFLERRDAFLHSQEKHRKTLENRYRRELEWLRRGPKARSTKARYRIKAAGELKDALGDVSGRLQKSSSQFEFSEGGKRSKALVELENVSKSYGASKIVDDLSLTISPGNIVGVVGNNGTGKSTLLKIIAGELGVDCGKVAHVTNLRVVYFDQGRETLDPDKTLKNSLCDSGDSVEFQGRSVHVVGWAKRFLFHPAQLDQPIAALSGGEHARVVLANLMRQPADVLILDEPTNDLDIPALEVLEESLMEFAGAVVIVTHDRYLLSRLCDFFIGLDGSGSAKKFASCEQWEREFVESLKEVRGKREEKGESRADSGGSKKKWSYQDKREYDGIERKIETAEAKLEKLLAEMETPEISADREKVSQIGLKIIETQNLIEQLYARWEELEEIKP